MIRLCIFLAICWSTACLHGQAFPKSDTAVVIIGGGIAGFSCASVCSSMGFSTIVCDTPHKDDPVRQKTITNWPAASPTSWDGALTKVKAKILSCKGRVVESDVVKITKSGHVFLVKTTAETLRARAVVVATGQEASTLPYQVVSHAQIISRLRDVMMFSPNDTVAVVGTGDEALLAAVKLACRVQKVFPILRTAASQPLEELAARLPNIEAPKYVRPIKISPSRDHVIVEYSYGASRLTKSATKVVIAEQGIPRSDLVKDLVSCDSSKAIVTSGEGGTTSVPGIFACGEVTRRGDMSASRAAADGLDVGWSVCYYLLEQGVLPERPREEPLVSQEERKSQSATSPEESKE